VNNLIKSNEKIFSDIGSKGENMRGRQVDRRKISSFVIKATK
jgi:hypothetical protein